MIQRRRQHDGQVCSNAARAPGVAPRAEARRTDQFTMRTAGWHSTWCGLRLRRASADRSRLERGAHESVTLGSPCQNLMEIKRASTANESTSLPEESVARHCGKHCQLPRRDDRTVATCSRRAAPGIVAHAVNRGSALRGRRRGGWRPCPERSAYAQGRRVCVALAVGQKSTCRRRKTGESSPGPLPILRACGYHVRITIVHGHTDYMALLTIFG